MPITNEVLAEKIDSLGSRLSDLQTTTQTFSTTFVSHEVFELRLRELNTATKQMEVSIANINLEIERLKSRRIVPQVVTAFLASAITAAFTYLLYARIQG